MAVGAKEAPTIAASQRPEPPGPADIRVLEIFERLMREKQLFRDPDRGWRIIHMIWDNER